MADIPELITLGVLEEKDADTYWVNVQIEVKKIVIENNGLEDFAGAYGWTPESNVPVHTKARDIIIQFVRDVFTSVISKKVDDEAAVTKAALLGQLL